MKKIRYSQDVDAMPIEISVARARAERHRPVAYAEDEGKMILHSSSEELVLIEILDVKQFRSNLLASEFFISLYSDSAFSVSSAV